MNIHIISCQVFYREISYLAALSEQSTTVVWMPQGLHDTPDLLRKSVQEQIDRLENDIERHNLKQNPDVILLGYGLCSNGVVGLHTRLLPLVVPRTDDCIAVFLGSQACYLSIFHENPGTYWLNNGWIESAFIPSEENYRLMYLDYAERYGEDNAEFLMENENAWIKKYNSCAYLTSQVHQQSSLQEQAEEIARYNQWEFKKFDGDLSMLKRMVNGIFLEDEVLVCPPNHAVAPTFDERKLCSQQL